MLFYLPTNPTKKDIRIILIDLDIIRGFEL